MINAADSQSLKPNKVTQAGTLRRDLSMFSSQQFGLGPITVDIGALKLVGGNQSKRVTPKSMRVLIELALRPMETVGRDDLLESVWPDTCPGPEVLTQAIKELRKALGDDQKAPIFIETVPKIGYRLLQMPQWQNALVVSAPVEHKRVPHMPARPLRSRSRMGLAIVIMALIALALWFARGLDPNESAYVDPVRSRIRMLTSAPGAELHPVISPDGRWFAYTAQVEGRNRIYLQRREGAEARLLNPTTPYSEVSPRFSPAGDELAFMRIGGPTVQGDSSDGCEIIARALTSPGERKLADCTSPMFSFDWVAPQELLLSQRVAPTQGIAIHRLNLSDGGLTRLGQMTAPHIVDWEPRLSPDRRKLAFRRGMGSDAALILAQADGSEPRVLAHLTTPLSGFDWLADSSGVLAASAHDDAIELQQWRPAQPPIYTGIVGAYPSISRAGDLLFNVLRDQSQLMEYNLASTDTALAVFPSTGVDFAPSLSPDGRYLAFVSTRGGMSQLWLGQLGQAPQALTMRRGNFSAPQWHRSGTRVLSSQLQDHRPDAVLLEFDLLRRRLREVLPPPGLGLIVRASYDAGGLIILSSKDGQRTLRRFLIASDTPLIDSTPAQTWAVDFTLDNIAGFQQDENSGELYFTRLGDAALYRHELGGGRTTVLAEFPRGTIYWAWRVREKTVYTLERAGQTTALWAQALERNAQARKLREVNASAALGDFSVNFNTGQLILTVTTADDTDIAWLPVPRR